MEYLELSVNFAFQILKTLTDTKFSMNLHLDHP